jgi:hypothetical protein
VYDKVFQDRSEVTTVGQATIIIVNTLQGLNQTIESFHQKNSPFDGTIKAFKLI